MTDLSFWIAALGVPLVVLFTNVIFRKLEKLPQSALPDLILCFVVFDAVVAIQHEDFAKFVQTDMLRDGIIGIYVVLIIVNMLIWLIAIRTLEPKLLAEYEGTVVANVMRSTRLVFLSGVMASVVVFMSVAPFAYSG